MPSHFEVDLTAPFVSGKNPTMWLFCWTILLAAVADPELITPEPETVIFEEKFEARLREGWSWVDENPNAWRIEAGKLFVRVEPESAKKDRSILRRNQARPEKSA